MENQKIIQIDNSRRKLIKGGIMVAAASPLIASSSAIAQSQSPFPRVGYRILSEQGSIFGLGAYSTNTEVGFHSDEILEEIGPNQLRDAISGLLQVSLLHSGQNDIDPGELTDPRIVRLDSNLDSRVEQVFNDERFLREMEDSDAQFYWVSMNPTFLAIVRGIFVTCIVPFLQGFFERTGSLAADRLWGVDCS